MRYCLLAILLFLVQTICAQVSHQFRNTPLIDAIRTIEQGQTEYTVSILSDGLTHLTTSARIEDEDALRAIKSLCKGLGVKVKEKNGNIIPNRSLYIPISFILLHLLTTSRSGIRPFGHSS